MRYKLQYIPKARRQRPGYPLDATSLTVHNTANPNATAQNHADYFGSRDLSSSAHIFVDDIEAIIIIPLTEQAWHSGTNAGNTTSIGIEVCEFSDRARQDKTDANAQELIAAMLTGKAPAGFRVRGMTTKNLRTHQSWSGKFCPRTIISWWPRFVSEIDALINPKEDTVRVMKVYHIEANMTPESDRERALRADLEAVARKHGLQLRESRTTNDDGSPRDLPKRFTDAYRIV